ncbi:MAG: GNAT family N-acetyltransferase [Gammaproteobacteria bacterium]
MPELLPATRLISPQTPAERALCFELRWQVLRQPWGQPPGSEQDSLDKNSIHKAIEVEHKIIATGRMHFPDAGTGCIRYMAVHPDFRNHGYGACLLQALESVAIKNNCNDISLQARNSAVIFYQHNGYQLIRKSHRLYDEIEHFEMTKTLDIKSYNDG